MTTGFDGKSEKWFSSVVICVHPKDKGDLVIRYDCELDKSYSFSFEEFERGSLVWVPLTPERVLGKKIQQKFGTEDENDSWWETEQVINVDVDKLEFTVNYFDTDSYDEWEDMDEMLDV